jgi:hypothetical protein
MAENEEQNDRDARDGLINAVMGTRYELRWQE